MWSILKNRLRQGYRTIPFPTGEVRLPERFRGRPALDPARCAASCDACAAVCPTGAVTTAPLRLDLGRCLFCGRCAEACPHDALRFTTDHRLAVRSRADLTLDGVEPRLAAPLDARLRRLLGRSLKLRQVSAGGCNACEADLNVLGINVFDLGRFGIQFVASPRHADGIVVTGPVSANMRHALLETWAAIPTPKIAIAVGACALAGGPFAGSDAVCGIPEAIPVDVYVPGCPPHPLTLLDALLRALGRLE